MGFSVGSEPFVELSGLVVGLQSWMAVAMGLLYYDKRVCQVVVKSGLNLLLDLHSPVCRITSHNSTLCFGLLGRYFRGCSQ